MINSRSIAYGSVDSLTRELQQDDERQQQQHLVNTSSLLKSTYRYRTHPAILANLPLPVDTQPPDELNSGDIQKRRSLSVARLEEFSKMAPNNHQLIRRPSFGDPLTRHEDFHQRVVQSASQVSTAKENQLDNVHCTKCYLYVYVCVCVWHLIVILYREQDLFMNKQ